MFKDDRKIIEVKETKNDLE